MKRSSVSNVNWRGQHSVLSFPMFIYQNHTTLRKLVYLFVDLYYIILVHKKKDERRDDTNSSFPLFYML